jgi:hypothetical protein
MYDMTPLTLEQLRVLVPSYVLGLLDAEERVAFDGGLQDPAFRATLERDMATHRATIELMAAAQPAASPRGAEVATATANRAKAVRHAPTSRATRALTPPTPASIIQRSTRRTARTAWWIAGLLGTALAAAVVMAVIFRNRATALEDRAARDRARISRVEAKLADQEKTLHTMLSGRGNVVVVNLNPAQAAGPGMQLFWSVRDGKAVVNAYGLAPVARDRAYMLWMIRDGTPVPLTLFTPDDDGRAIVASVELPTTTSGITLLVVTDESSAGANAPTTPPLLMGEVPAKGATP